MTIITPYVYIHWDGTPALESGARSITIRRGRQSSISGDTYQMADPGTASVVFNNFDGRFDLFNTSSPIHDYLLPNRRVVINVESDPVDVNVDHRYKKSYYLR